MGYCWYCYHGWPKQVAEIYLRSIKDIGSSNPLLYGPSHIVWSDENFNDSAIESCIKFWEKENEAMRCDYRRSMPIIRRSLEELKSLPESVRCPEPPGWDDDEDADEYPENYPPAVGVEMITRKKLASMEREILK